MFLFFLYLAVTSVHVYIHIPASLGLRVPSYVILTSRSIGTDLNYGIGIYF